MLSCQSDGKSGWQELNLMRYNIPVSIMAPDSAKVNTAEVSGVVRDVTIEDAENDFLVQIFSGQAFTSDLARLKSAQLELVRDNPYFSRIVKEDPAGFIFENKIDSTSAFGFRYVVYQGDLEIVMQNGMGRIFNQEAVEQMYESVSK
ncbi:hypothetical protein CEQ90_09680 [Lewinellaceae bacterium SD302]|nr:hypothetical protein CEQ90_09680 [Lewinellaceae bacterium SD302]